METGIYIRVSTEEQAQEGFSIRAQEQKLKEFAKIKEWSIYKIYADEGISGKNIVERPAINEMITDIKSGQVKNVLVFKIDRLTRSTKDLIALIDLFNEHDCTFNSLMESIDTQTASGRMFLKIIGIFAEFERENIVERVTLGLERKVKEGYSLCSRSASYGYDRPKGQKVQTINEKEAKIVRDIFDLYVNQHISFNGIVRRLNTLEIPTKENSTWNVNKVKNILTNCNYIGKVRYRSDDNKRCFETEGHHEPIITQELFNEAQNIISKITLTESKKRPKASNYFYGILVCSKCEKKLVTHNNYSKLVNGGISSNCSYRCKNSRLKSCNAPSMSHTKVEEAFKNYINTIADFSVTDEMQIKEQEAKKQRNMELTQSYKNKQKKLQKKFKEVMSLYVDNVLSFDEYRTMKEKVEDDIAFVQLELKKLEAQNKKEVTIEKEDIITTFKENWEHLSDIEKRQFLFKFINKILIVSEKEKGEFYGTVKIVDVEFVQ